MVNNVCVIIRHPLADERFTLGLRNALATQMTGYETTAVVIANAVLSFTGGMPDYLAQIIASYLENEGKLYLLKDDLQNLKLSPADISTQGVELLDNDDLAEILEDSDTISTF